MGFMLKPAARAPWFVDGGASRPIHSGLYGAAGFRDVKHDAAERSGEVCRVHYKVGAPANPQRLEASWKRAVGARGAVSMQPFQSSTCVCSDYATLDVAERIAENMKAQSSA